tara:strand:- start:3898 stop:4227 length:330 start_codon:yes stop_codon:yes gene_type:complete
MRLKSDFIVSAALRKADSMSISAFVHKKGDPDAGAIFLELELDRNSVQLLHRRFDFDENEIWECLNKGQPQPAYIISEQIEREITRDPDCWVISVQDRQARNIFTLTSG